MFLEIINLLQLHLLFFLMLQELNIFHYHYKSNNNYHIHLLIFL
nr:MAG TPA: hypothetical protein [Caudoviricetes sp.]